MAYNFAMSYLKQYPSENVGPSSFACDETIRNAKFESTLKALGVPVSEVERPLFVALVEQDFTVQFDFINTAMSCIALSIVEVTESSASLLPNVSCWNDSGILSARVLLPQHAITVRAILSNIFPVGGVRVGMSGSGQAKDTYTLQALNFSEALYSAVGRTLGQQATIKMTITKVDCFSSLGAMKKYPACSRSSMRPSLYRTATPSSEVFGCRHLPTARTRCLSMLLVMSPPLI